MQQQRRAEMQLGERVQVGERDVGQQAGRMMPALWMRWRDGEARGDVGGSRAGRVRIEQVDFDGVQACRASGRSGATSSETTWYPRRAVVADRAADAARAAGDDGDVRVASSRGYRETRARTRSGLPEPPLIFSGGLMMSAPVGGSWSRLLRHCRPKRPLPCMKKCEG